MKFFELSDALHPAVSGGLARASYLQQVAGNFFPQSASRLVCGSFHRF